MQNMFLQFNNNNNHNVINVLVVFSPKNLKIIIAAIFSFVFFIYNYVTYSGSARLQI
jgi:hypothetical protein